MKIKSIMRVISASITLLAFFMFLFISCSKDDTNDESDAFSPGYTWPEGDYPSLTAPNFNDGPTIGSPVLTLTAKHVGDFSPNINAIECQNWIGDITRIEGWYCDDIKVPFDFSSENHWSSTLPIRDYYFDYNPLSVCNDSALNDYDISWDDNLSRRLKLMEYGNWNYDQFVKSTDKNVGGYLYRITWKFKQIDLQPELYMSIHRDWIYEYGTDVIRSGEGTREISTETKTGVVDTQISTISETLELGAEVSYGAVSASINQTFSSETTNQIEFSEFTTETITDTYVIPADETWRFITLYGVERYSFTDINGDSWESPHLVTEELGYIEDHVRTFLMIVKYKSASVSPINSELIELDL